METDVFSWIEVIDDKILYEYKRNRTNGCVHFPANTRMKRPLWHPIIYTDMDLNSHNKAIEGRGERHTPAAKPSYAVENNYFYWISLNTAVLDAANARQRQRVHFNIDIFFYSYLFFFLPNLYCFLCLFYFASAQKEETMVIVFFFSLSLRFYTCLCARPSSSK